MLKHLCDKRFVDKDPRMSFVLDHLGLSKFKTSLIENEF